MGQIADRQTRRGGTCRRWAALLALVLAGAPSDPARAAGTKDFTVLARALSFIEGPEIAGSVELIVIIDRASPASVEASEATMKALEGDLGVGTISFAARYVDVADLGQVPEGAVVFLTPGLGERRQAVFDRASEAGLLTVSTDQSCVRQGHCVMAIQTRPTLEVVINRAAAAASSIDFKSAFRLLARQI